MKNFDPYIYSDKYHFVEQFKVSYSSETILLFDFSYHLCFNGNSNYELDYILQAELV